MAVDPVCKMFVDENSAQYFSEYKGTNYYFCAPGCKKKFDSDPKSFTKGHHPSHGEHGHCCAH